MNGFDQIIEQLGDVVAECRRRKHRAGYFAALYLRTTVAVHSKAKAGEFDDAARMEHFAKAFAQRYLEAYQAWQNHQPTTATWQLAFDAADRRRPIVLQHLVLGMSAHINLDLGVVAADLGRQATGGLQSIQNDFGIINAVLASELDASQSCVNRVSPLILIADGAGLRSDEALCRFSLNYARGEAWRSAQQLYDCPPKQLEPAIRRRDQVVAAFGKHMVRPGGLLGAAVGVVRLGEFRSVPHVIDTLADQRTLQPL